MKRALICAALIADEGDHYCDWWSEALEMVEGYVALLEGREVAV